MAEALVTEERFAAGREYLNALEALGFKPEGAVWTMRPDEPETLELSLFTAVVDRVGTKSIFDSLFMAYDKAKTPQSFDPWQVSIYSPRQFFYEMMMDRPEGSNISELEIEMTRTGHRKGDESRTPVLVFTAKRYFKTEWAYYLPSKSKSKANQLSGWSRFERTVRQAA